jgi:hypothetical protein
MEADLAEQLTACGDLADRQQPAAVFDGVGRTVMPPARALAERT